MVLFILKQSFWLSSWGHEFLKLSRLSDAQGGKAVISPSNCCSYKEYFYQSNLLHLTCNTDIGLRVIGTSLAHTNL